MRRKRRNYEDLQSGQVMSLEEATEYLQAHRLPLHYDSPADVDIWPKKVPLPLRRSLIRHKQELLSMMHQGNVTVCPSRLHEPYWHDSTCLMCEQLDKWMDGGQQYN